MSRGAFAHRLDTVRAQVAAAAQKAGRSPADVRIVAVSKYADAAAVTALADAGQRDFGENYVQSALAKITALQRPDLRWHLIGPLQSNKAARAARAFYLIHTLASESAVAAIAQALRPTATTCRVLVQIRLSIGRAGVEPEEASDFVFAATNGTGIIVDGVMGLAPLGEDPRPHFARLRRVLDDLRALRLPNAPLSEMSAGMSDDFVDAIAEGATMVRIGRALFGTQPRKETY